tara:strand:- start:1155 stop:2024 length:870 start_codon:yes stop_codon:yes gene_type:complete
MNKKNEGVTGRKTIAARWRLLLVSGVVSVLLSGFAVAQEALPDSLAAMYPPVADEQTFLHGMMDMGHAYSGIFLDLQQGEPENARQNYEQFKSLYLFFRSAIPEWEERFPLEPIDMIGPALDSGDIEQAFNALMAARGVCGSCHGDYMIRVQQAYHWPKFSEVTIVEPVSGNPGPYSALKWPLQDSFSGLINDARQGQIDNVEQHFANFTARLGALATTCTQCHETERRYYLDAVTLEVVEALSTAISADSMDGSAVARAARQVNEQICFQCHLVHMPAAYSSAENQEQ